MFSKRRMCRICRARGLRRSADLAVVTRADVRPPPPPEPGDDADAGDGTILCGTVGGAFNAEEGAHGADTAVHDDRRRRTTTTRGIAWSSARGSPACAAPRSSRDNARTTASPS